MEGAEKYHRSIDPSGQSSVAQLLRWIPQGAKVLEMGPATGVMTQLLSEQKQCDVTCIEIDPKAADVASNWCSRMIVANLNQTEWEGGVGDQRFDFIIFADVLEHLLDPKVVLERSLKFLKLDGEVLISVPNIGYVGVIAELLEGRFDYRRDGLLDETHTHFFTRHSLVQLLAQSGLKGLEWSRTCIAPELSEFRLQLSHLGANARTTLAAVPDGDTYQFLVRASRKGVSAELQIPDTQLPSQRLIASQVFFDTGDGFNESTSLSIQLSENNNLHKVRVDAPSGTKAVRIDPVDAALPVWLDQIRIYAREKEIVRWDSAEGPVSARFGLLNAREFAVGGVDLLIPENNDPGIIISHPGFNTGAGVEIEFIFSLRVSDALEKIAGCVEKQKSTNELYREQIKNLEDYQIILAANLTEATKTIHSSQDKLLELQSSKAEIEVRLAQVAETARAAAHELELIRGKNVALEDEKQGLRSGLAYAEHQLAMSRNAAVAARNDLAYAEHELAAARRSFEQVITSTSWKITKPVRVISESIRSYRSLVVSFIKARIRSLVRMSVPFLSSELAVRLWSLCKLGTDYEMRMHQNGPSRVDLQSYRKQSARWKRKPQFSVIMPTYKTNPRWLKEAIESVRGQTYSDWELCIADDASNDPGVRSILSTYGANDSRIKVVFLDKNGHISRASNAALDLATGEYVVLLDHDDLFAPHALHKLAERIIADTSLDLLYSDEDKISQAGRRFEPTCKPSWSPEYFLSFMYTGHISCFRSSLVRSVGGFREGFEGSQDYDLMLRLTELTDKVAHIPEVLYHWRVHDQSVAGNLDSKPYAFEAAKRALTEALARRGFQQGSVSDSSARGLYLIDRRKKIELTGIVRLSAKAKSKGFVDVSNNEVCVSDEASAVRELLSLAKQKEGFIALTANSSHQRDGLSRLLDHAAEGAVGVVAPLLVDVNRRIHAAGMSIVGSEVRPNFRGLSFGDIGYRGRLVIPFNVSVVAPNFLIFRTELLSGISDEIKTLSELVFALCLNAHQRKLRCVVDPSVVVEVCDETGNFEPLSRRQIKTYLRDAGMPRFQDPFLPAGLIAWTGSAEMPAV